MTQKLQKLKIRWALRQRPFRKFLENYKGLPFGRGIATSCPLARYLESRGFKNPAVGTAQVEILGCCGVDLPYWCRWFVYEYDRRVNSKTALEALDAIST